MTEKDAEVADGSNVADGGLQEHIAHWADVLDRWVKGVDARLGRQDGGWSTGSKDRRSEVRSKWGPRTVDR